MHGYKNILVAVELRKEDDTILKKAQELAKLYNATLSLVHVVEHFSSFTLAAGIVLEEQVKKELDEKLESLAKSIGISNKDTYLCVGSIASGIEDVTQKVKADLIVVGNHSKHGLALLFSGPIDSIINSSKSKADVLVVDVNQSH
jgi:universal stress protein A